MNTNSRYQQHGGKMPPAPPPQLMSSDEAPDTGDDSDDDLITSYLGDNTNAAAANNANNSNINASSAGAVPSISVTSAKDKGNNHILEENLLQLAEIHENIQRMRLENAADAARQNHNTLVVSGLSPVDGRLSTSCPSLNNELFEAANYYNNNQVIAAAAAAAHQRRRDFNAENNNGSTTPTSSASNTGRSGRKKMPASSNASNNNHHQEKKKKAVMGGRHRSVSVSSGDSDEDSNSHQLPHHHHHHHHHHLPQYHRHASASDAVDGCFPQPRPRSSSSADPDKGVFKTPPDIKLLPRPPTSKKSSTPNLFSQFPALQKSISTPSIVVDHPHHKSRGKFHPRSPYPEPTHVFLQKLISEHEWTRRSGTDTESDGDDFLGPLSSSGGAHPSSGPSSGQLGFYPAGAANRFLEQAKGSPQLSLAEFLQDGPNLEEDDQRKRRRKKERSSLFFRKKNKDKVAANFNNPSSNSNTNPMATARSSSASGHPHHHYHHQHHQHGASQGDGGGGGQGGNAVVGPGSKSLAKAPSAINLGSKTTAQGRLPQHSYSMSSLRKNNSTSGLHNNAINQQGSSSFYLAKGELSKTSNPEDDFLGQEDTQGLIEGEYIPGEEFAEGGPAAIRNLDTDPFLKIQDDEAESWQQSLKSDPSISTLTPQEVKRQEHIYELIVTESNHCQVLKVIQKIFVECMYKHLNMSKEIVDRIFPCLDELIDLHFKFLTDLRIRQAEGNVVETVADILVEQFSGESAFKWKDAYGTFCSQHNEAVTLYKEMVKNDRRFQQFVRQCAENPLLKKKGIPECILFVTTRITKYPLLIEPLIKTAKDLNLPQEKQKLIDANHYVRDILKEVNSRVAEKEREQRFLEIYKGIDAKSSVFFEGKKFKKSDVLSSSRKLMFEGSAVLKSDQKRSFPVIVVVLSDILFFLNENNGKYYFVAPENKPAVVPVETLLAQEKQGTNTKSLYIISTSPGPEPSYSYDIDIQQPPTREDWIVGIREAVDSKGFFFTTDSAANDEEIRAREKWMRVRHLVADLRGKDVAMARLMEDQMRVMGDMCVVMGTKDPLRENPPDYVSMVKEKDSAGCSKEDLLEVIKEASKHLQAISNNSSNSNLNRSVSSVGENKSAAYNSPGLPKRADTFGGFDQQPTAGLSLPRAEGGQQQYQQDDFEGQNSSVVNLAHCLNSLTCMISEHFTSLEAMRAEMAEMKDKSTWGGGKYKQNEELEKLKYLQEFLPKEERRIQLEKEHSELELEAKRKDLARVQIEVERGVKDVQAQRDELYRKLEVLKSKGIEVGPNMSVLKTSEPVVSGSPYSEVNSNNVSPTGTVNLSAPQTSLRKGSLVVQGSSSSQLQSLASGGSLKKDSMANLNLLSTTNEVKQGVEKPEIKQQIPMKLTTKLSSSSSSSSANLSAKVGDKSKKLSSVVGLKQSSLTASSLSGSLGNIAKPLVESSGVQQILPFKLSEQHPSPSEISAMASLKKSSSQSPKTGYQKLSQHHHHHYQQQQQQQHHHHQQHYQRPAPPPPQQQHLSHDGELEISHQRTGSSPALIPPKGPSSNNTLPKSSASSSSGSRKPPQIPPHQRAQHSSSSSSSEDKVIYF